MSVTSFDPSHPGLRSRVSRILKAMPDQPFTCRELSERIQESHQCTSRFLREFRMLGWVEVINGDAEPKIWRRVVDLK